MNRLAVDPDVAVEIALRFPQPLGKPSGFPTVSTATTTTGYSRTPLIGPGPLCASAPPRLCVNFPSRAVHPSQRTRPSCYLQLRDLRVLAVQTLARSGLEVASARPCSSAKVRLTAGSSNATRSRGSLTPHSLHLTPYLLLSAFAPLRLCVFALNSPHVRLTKNGRSPQRHPLTECGDLAPTPHS